MKNDTLQTSISNTKSINSARCPLVLKKNGLEQYFLPLSSCHLMFVNNIMPCIFFIPMQSYKLYIG